MKEKFSVNYSNILQFYWSAERYVIFLKFIYFIFLGLLTERMCFILGVNGGKVQSLTLCINCCIEVKENEQDCIPVSFSTTRTLTNDVKEKMLWKPTNHINIQLPLIIANNIKLLLYKEALRNSAVSGCRESGILTDGWMAGWQWTDGGSDGLQLH